MAYLAEWQKRSVFFFFLFLLPTQLLPKDPEVNVEDLKTCIIPVAEIGRSNNKIEQNHGKILAQGLIQLTIPPSLSESRTDGFRELADPSPPFITDDGHVEIYGTGDFYIRYKNWEEFDRGGFYEIIPFPIKGCWDVRKYRLIHDDRKIEIIFIAGYAPTTWESRRLYIIRNGALSPIPIFGDPTTGWKGHSYGGNFFQSGTSDPNTIYLDRPFDLYFEMVEGDTSHITEEFRIPMNKDLKVKENAPAEKIFGIMKGSKPYPATQRTDGRGYLAEGGRPFEFTSAHHGSTVIVPLSTGDFFTDSYTTAVLVNRHKNGPFLAEEDGGDIKDYGHKIKNLFPFAGLGRPVIYLRPDGEYEMMLHGYNKSAFPARDWSTWKNGVDTSQFNRSLLKQKIHIEIDAAGKLDLRLLLNTPKPISHEPLVVAH
ncbi:MAG: hypothetical protein JWQ35_2531 [Bacteriovoracaceae bacterium]|nr:hypothetical protein [Bacteriovoracaceae bacterium]